MKDNNRIIQDKPLLFNLEIDPEERFNIAEDNLEIVKEIEEMVRKHKNNVKPVKDQLAERLN